MDWLKRQWLSLQIKLALLWRLVLELFGLR
jgi:hypothetical protein